MIEYLIIILIWLWCAVIPTAVLMGSLLYIEKTRRKWNKILAKNEKLIKDWVDNITETISHNNKLIEDWAKRVQLIDSIISKDIEHPEAMPLKKRMEFYKMKWETTGKDEDCDKYLDALKKYNQND